MGGGGGPGGGGGGRGGGEGGGAGGGGGGGFAAALAAALAAAFSSATLFFSANAARLAAASSAFLAAASIAASSSSLPPRPPAPPPSRPPSRPSPPPSLPPCLRAPPPSPSVRGLLRLGRLPLLVCLLLCLRLRSRLLSRLRLVVAHESALDSEQRNRLRRDPNLLLLKEEAKLLKRLIERAGRGADGAQRVAGRSGVLVSHEPRRLAGGVERQNSKVEVIEPSNIDAQFTQADDEAGRGGSVGVNERLCSFRT